ncbi:MAG: tubulin-like doman-containing protein [Lachnospiraceae bacterium]|nr:tubulin-like doman-containing protein [Lachnospiraceae bacterium]
MNAPTLLIGLGGTGSKIIEKVSKMVTPEERNNIAFAVFDTDINELDTIQRRNPFIKTIQTSTKQTVGEYLKQDTHARDEWFPVNAILNGKTLTEGAGQVRSISRLALETVIRAGKMEPLHEAIQSLYKVEEDKKDQALRIVIVSSLAGGTGSGLILPVALYTRNYLQTHYRQSANIARGFFILPEVFYEVIPGLTERNNLKANAYATLRELDAFLMKGDNTLHERYADSVSMKFPVPAGEGYEEYDVRPYDFCFLFDAQNAEGGKLNSFDQYLEHAANCIYSQSIGPMNKRSNSSEDNTIRKLAKERGRNRYAGAGASMLVYPFEDIRTLIAMKWMKTAISAQWMTYDNLYKDLVKENEKKREANMTVTEQSLASFYVNQIESAEKNGDAFAGAIYRSTGRYNNGFTRQSDLWVDYVNALLGKVKSDVDAGSSELTVMEDDIQGAISNLEKWNEFGDTFQLMLEYNNLAMRYVDEVSQTLAYAMFSESKFSDGPEKGCRIENYLRNDGRFMHPNAIRYFLIKTADLLRANKKAIDGELAENAEWVDLDKFRAKTFDDKKTKDVVEDENSLSDKKDGLFDKAEKEKMQKAFRTFMAKLKDYTSQRVQSYVLGKGVDYVDSLISAFEGFYKSFEVKLDSIDKNIIEIYKKYSESKGTTVRYVCASKDCLNKIIDKRPYMGSSLTIDSKLAEEIYKRVRAYAVAKDKPSGNRFFSDIFDKDIVGYFKGQVDKNHGAELDIDVIDALEMEAELSGQFDDQDDAYRLIQQYIVKVINDTRKLSCPFIESPMGEQREPINACAFNDSLKPDKGDESPRAQLIRKELMNNGGSPDEDINKGMIMFYQSFYGLRANDLSKFAPPEKSITYNRSSGEYYKAYFELIKGVHPESDKSKEITPHIDKWWHIITKMPDLDEDSQAKQEYNIYAAFFWAILNGYITLTPESEDTKLYKVRSIRLGMESEDLIVSNGTECDKLYEVLDAIAIYPELTKKILDKVEIEKTNDLNESRNLEGASLLDQLKNFKLDEPGIGKDHEASTCIFDLPLLMKKSATPDIYYEADVVELLRIEIEEIKNYISNFCGKKELVEVCGRIIKEQFEAHVKTLEKESAYNSNIYKESLFQKTCDVIYKALEDLGLRKDAKYVLDKAQELKEA